MSERGAFLISPTVRWILAKRSRSFAPGTDEEALQASAGVARVHGLQLMRWQ